MRKGQGLRPSTHCSIYKNINYCFSSVLNSKSQQSLQIERILREGTDYLKELEEKVEKLLRSHNNLPLVSRFQK